MKKLMVIRSGNTTAFGDFRTHVLRSNSYTPEQRASWKTHKKVRISRNIEMMKNRLSSNEE